MKEEFEWLIFSVGQPRQRNKTSIRFEPRRLKRKKKIETGIEINQERELI